MKRKDKKSKVRFFSTVLPVIILFTGIALILYPLAANFINDSVNGKVIGEYRKQVEFTGAAGCGKILDEVRKYNEELARTAPYISDLTKEERERYESLLNVTGSGIMGYIEIPKADIYLAIYHGTGENVLQTGVGHLEGSSLPARGESVHAVLTGHSGLPSARLFTDIGRLDTGDTFTINILNEKLTYEVKEIFDVLPGELENMRIEEGREICTLVTCTPYGINTRRLAVTGERIDTPDMPDDIPPVIRAAASKWNRMFVFLPPVIFIIIVITVAVVRKKQKNKKDKDIDEGQIHIGRDGL